MRSASRHATRLFGASAIVLVAALAAGCGSSHSSTQQSSLPTSILDTAKVERSIEQSIFAQRHVHAAVTCPKVVPQEKGRDFNCLAEIGSAKTVFAVTQTNDSGFVTYHAK